MRIKLISLRVSDCCFKLRNVTHLFPLDTEDLGAFALVFEDHLNHLTTSVKEALIKSTKQYSGAKFVQIKYTNDEEFVKKTSKLMPETTARKLANELKLQENYVLFLAVGKKNDTVFLFIVN